MRHIIGVDVTEEDAAAIRRATGEDPEAVIEAAAEAAVAILIAKGRQGLEADRLQAAGEIEVGRAA